ncbi:MAG: S1C family serine protease, partial [Patescibacteria group bacterium]
GTGVVVTSDGLILTTKKNLGSYKNTVKAVLSDGRTFDATVTAFDSRSELALIKIPAANLPVVQFGNSADLVIGQKLVTVGPDLIPFGNPGVEAELVKNADVIATYPKIFLTDSVNSYLSVSPDLENEFWGSAVLDSKSRVIGFVTDSGILTGEFLLSSLNNYLANGKFSRPSAGFQYAIITPPISGILHLPKSEGALLLAGSGKPAVVANSAAARAGLREGDFIYRVNGRDLSADYTLEKVMNEARPGDKIEIAFYRGSQETTAVIILGSL